MRYPHHTEHHTHNRHEGGCQHAEYPGHRHGHGHGHGSHKGHPESRQDCRHEGRMRGDRPRGGRPDRMGRHEGRRGPGGRGRPTLSRGILRSAKRIERAGLEPAQLHELIASHVSHADYITTMRTLRTVSRALKHHGSDA